MPTPMSLIRTQMILQNLIRVRRPIDISKHFSIDHRLAGVSAGTGAGAVVRCGVVQVQVQ
jgi:hypothetical protein